jgi:hypothetical protein
VIHDGCGVVNNPSEILPLFWAIALLLMLLALKKRDVQLRIKNQPSLQTAKDEENVG